MNGKGNNGNWFAAPEAKSALNALRKCRVGVLSTTHASGRPSSAIVNFTVDDEFRFYFVTQKETEKFKNLSKQKEVALNIGFNDERVDNFQVVGKAAVVKDPKLWASLLKTLVGTKVVAMPAMGLPELTAHYPFRSFPVRDHALVVVTPRWIRRFHHPTKDRAPRYTQILSRAS